jgi:hypothetical protein
MSILGSVRDMEDTQKVSDERWEDDEQVIRALLVKHGYPPDLPPRGVTGPPGEIVNGYKSRAGQIVPARLRNWVCTLEGVIIDGHSDQDNTGLCMLCGRELP